MNDRGTMVHTMEAGLNASAISFAGNVN